jgi:hypothetical protein
MALEIAPRLAEGLGANRDLTEAVQGAVCRRATELLQTLGVPGRPSLEIRPLDSNYASPDRWLRLSVGGQRCRYSPLGMERVFSRAGGAPSELPADFDHIQRWLQDRLSSTGQFVLAGRHAITEFLVLACFEIIRSQPAVLLGPEQTAVYGRHLRALRGTPTSAWATPFDTTWLQSILRDVLSLRISIAEMDTVSQVLSDAGAKEHPAAEIAEKLIAALRPTVVEIRLPSGYLRQISTADGGTGQGCFGRLRDALFYEFGLKYPEFKFVPVESLQPNTFAFRINHLTTLPRTGLLPRQ